MPEPTPVRINLGAGLQAAPGWINYDRSRSAFVARLPAADILMRLAFTVGLVQKPRVLAWPKTTCVRDLTRGIPHADNSVDVVYSSHMLEHLPPDQAQFILQDAFRVLRPGSVLRLVVPDLASAVQAYLNGDHAYFHAPGVPIADAFMTTFYDRAQVPRGSIERLMRGILRTEDGGHKWMYDAESLRYRLERASFIEIQQVRRGEGREPSAAGLDSRSAHGLHFEAIKPRSTRRPSSRE